MKYYFLMILTFSLLGCKGNELNKEELIYCYTDHLNSKVYNTPEFNTYYNQLSDTLNKWVSNDISYYKYIQASELELDSVVFFNKDKSFAIGFFSVIRNDT